MAGVAGTPDVDEGVCTPRGVEAIENRREYTVVPEPAVNDHDFCRAIAYRFVPNHLFPLTSFSAAGSFRRASAKADLFLVSRRKNLPAGGDAIDGRGDADIGHQLHHDLDQFLPRDAASQGSADMG